MVKGRINGFMMKYIERIAMLLFVCFFSLTCVNVSALTVNAQKTEEEQAWEDYCKDLNTQGKAVIRTNIDDVPMDGYGIYYYTTWSSTKTLNEMIADKSLIQLTESSKYKGCFVVDLTLKDNDTKYFTPNNIYLISDSIDKSTATFGVNFDEFKYIDRDFIYFGDDNVADLDFYTISYEQGDVELMELPESYLHIGKHDYDKDEPEYYMSAKSPGWTSDHRDIQTGGYAFSHWAYYDENNEEKTLYGSTTVNKPMKLHPCFINEEKIKSDENYGTKTSGAYSDWTYIDTLTVTTSDEFLKAITDYPYTDLSNPENPLYPRMKKHFIIVDGDININKDVVTAFLAAHDTEYNHTTLKYDETLNICKITVYGYESSNFIIIKDGSTVTLDGVVINCNANWENSSYFTPITVQDGGKLILKKYSELNYATLFNQKQGQIEVDDTSYLRCNCLYNYGKLHISKREDLNDKMYMYKFRVYDTFFNAKGATFEADFGEYDFCLDQNMWTVDENKNEVGNLSLVPMRNNGTMIFSELCYCEFGDGSQGGSVYQHDRCAQMPFINNGTINVKNKYNNTEVNRAGTLEIRYSSFINKGTLNIDNYKGQLYEDSIGASYRGLGIYAAELVNTGTINVNSYAGKGISLEGLYYDPSQCSNEYKSVTEKQKGRIINKSGGNININTAKNSIGLLISDNNLVDNAGRITLEFINPSEIDRSMSFVIQRGYYDDRAAEVNNTGIIVNNGYIAKTNKDKELIWKGNEWTGTGKEGVYLYGKNYGGDDPSEDPSDDPSDNPGENGNTDGGSSQTPITQAPNLAPATQTPVAEGGSIDSTNSSDKFSTYTVTSSDTSAPEVAYTGLADKKATKVTVPSTVESNGVTYKVTSIEDNAFKGNTKLTSVTISANVEEIGNNAFSGCSSLKSVTLPAKVSKIGNNAFKGCKKLKTLTIKSTKLTTKTISKNAFKGITTKTTIKVPKKMKKTYTKLFRKKGLNKKVKVAGM